MYEVTIRQLAPRPTAVIRTTTEPAALAQAFDEILPATWQAAQAAGRTPTGPPFGRYFAFSEAEVDLEAGIPLDAPIVPAGRVVASELPGGEAACLVHVGPYETLIAAHEALEQWMQEHGRQAAGPVWESYVTDPGSEPDSSQWRTELLLPLVPAAPSANG